MTQRSDILRVSKYGMIEELVSLLDEYHYTDSEIGIACQLATLNGSINVLEYLYTKRSILPTKESCIVSAKLGIGKTLAWRDSKLPLNLSSHDVYTMTRDCETSVVKSLFSTRESLQQDLNYAIKFRNLRVSDSFEQVAGIVPDVGTIIELVEDDQLDILTWLVDNNAVDRDISSAAWARYPQHHGSFTMVGLYPSGLGG